MWCTKGEWVWTGYAPKSKMSNLIFQIKVQLKKKSSPVSWFQTADPLLRFKATNLNPKALDCIVLRVSMSNFCVRMTYTCTNNLICTHTHKAPISLIPISTDS